MAKKGKTLWHRLLGKLLELLLTPVNITVLTEPELTGKADIVLLRRQGEIWTAEQQALLPDGVRDSKASHILLEFKYSASVNEPAIRQALSYDTFYRAGKLTGNQKLQTFLLSARTPEDRTLNDFGYYLTGKAGVYDSRNILLKGLPILLLNELSDAPHNSFVKCFASRRRVAKEALKQAVGVRPGGEKSLKFWAYMVSLQNAILGEGGYMTEESVTTPEDLMELGELFIERALSAMSVEERLRGLPAEEWLRGLPVEERLRGLTAEERLSG